MSVSGPKAAMVSKHSSKMEERELLELRGLEVKEEFDLGLPFGSMMSSTTGWLRERMDDQRRSGLPPGGERSINW